MKVCEYIHRLFGTHARIRVWGVAADGFSEAEAAAQELAVSAAFALGGTLSEIAERVARLPFCNAVEVVPTDRNGPGFLIYPEWP